MSVLEHHIRECLLRYLSGDISLTEFEKWFASETWNVDIVGDERHAQLTHEIELLLAEYTNGHWTEAELREQLQRYAEAPLTSHIEIRSSVGVAAVTSRTTGFAAQVHFFPMAHEPHRITSQQAA